MFTYIKKNYRKGDSLKLTSVNGEYVGEILFISDESIILKTVDGKTCGIKGCDITFFEEINSDDDKPCRDETTNSDIIKNTQSDIINENVVMGGEDADTTDTELNSVENGEIRKNESESVSVAKNDETITDSLINTNVDGGQKYRLSKVAKELNVGASIIVDFLAKKGVQINANPNTKISQELYVLLVNNFSSDRTKIETANDENNEASVNKKEDAIGAKETPKENESDVPIDEQKEPTSDVQIQNNNKENEERTMEVGSYRLSDVADEFNLSVYSAWDFLKKNGYNIYCSPGTLVTEEIHELFSRNFQSQPCIKNKSEKAKNKVKPSQIFKEFKSLQSLLDEERKSQNDKYVPAFGEIKMAQPLYNYGFIVDGKSKKKIYFSFNQIVDETIVKNSGSMYRLPVVYSIQGSSKGEMAITIHKPNKVSKLLELVQKLVLKDETKHAKRVLEHILREYPDNYAANELMQKMEAAFPQPKPKEYSNLYSHAKKCLSEKNYPQAIEYFIKAIKAKERLESSIKDLGMLYAQLYKLGGDNALEYREKAVSLMVEYKKDLPKTISSLYYLENLYYSIQDYERFINIAIKLLDTKEFQKDKSRSSQLLCKMAAAYIQDGKKENAKDTIEEVLSYDPNHQGALKLKTAIESDNQEDIFEIISATQFETLISGLSAYIQQTLDAYNEYAGVDAKTKESGNYDENTLKGVRGIIERFSVNRSKDRAPYLLTEAKLMQEIEPENAIRIRTVLARYCIDMATTHISEYNSLDIIRFFYNEAFALEEHYTTNAKYVAIYILTQVADYSDLLQATIKNVTVDSALNMAMKSNSDRLWTNILYMFLYNREISANLTLLFFTKYKELSIRALFNIGIKINSNPNKEEFTEAWNSAREKLMSYNNRIIASIRAILKTSNLEEMYQQLLSLNDMNKEWMFALDVIRLNTIINNIGTAINTYLKSSGYRNKEANRNNANGQIQQLMEEIKKAPTKLSYEEFLPLLASLDQLLSESFNDVIRMSEPRINIKLLSGQTVINDNGVVNMQVEVENHKDSSPIKEVSLSLDESSNIKLINADNTLYNAIEGGESHIFKLQLEVGKDIIDQKATAVTIYCNYQNGGEQKQASNQLSLKLYSQDEFTPIENPYAPIADGGPVPLDSKMFYGRETEIENIVDAIIKSPSKQIIIYGQKRSGKSSVMLHLKQSLLDTGKTFCVFFSLGEILNNLNEASFYYKILDSIKQELEFIEMSGEQVPKYDIPPVKEFKTEDEENPLNTFTKYMIKFKMSCKQTEGWENKNLVVMIDEFTYLYSGIKNGSISSSIMKQWKAVTQNERAQFSVVLVGQDVVPSFKKEDYARNAFGVIQDMRLTYLKEESARALIEKPILDEDGHSRYIGNAVSKIIEWTSRNPYYIQIFCSRLVDFMNNNKSISVTEADVSDVARSFVDGSDALEEDKFDNLIRAGESEDLQEYAEADILDVLHQIALRAKNIGYCNRADIDVFTDKEKEDAIINDLCNREVLETKSDNNYKIQVKLFQEWLLKH